MVKRKLKNEPMTVAKLQKIQRILLKMEAKKGKKKPWVRLTCKNKKLNKNPKVKKYLDECAEKIQDKFNQVYDDLSVFGSAVIFIPNKERKPCGKKKIER